MYVYLVGSGIDYEGSQIIGVFSSKETALEFIETEYPDYIRADNQYDKNLWIPLNEKARCRVYVDYLFLNKWELNGDIDWNWRA